MNEIAPIDAGHGAPAQSYLRQYELVERVRAYDPSADVDLLNKAYVFTVQAQWPAEAP